MVTDDALAAGSVPDPGAAGDPDSSLMMHQFFEWDRTALEYLTQEGKTGVQRKLPSSKMTLAMVVDNDAGSNASLLFAFSLRVLFAWK